MGPGGSINSQDLLLVQSAEPSDHPRAQLAERQTLGQVGFDLLEPSGGFLIQLIGVGQNLIVQNFFLGSESQLIFALVQLPLIQVLVKIVLHGVANPGPKMRCHVTER